MTKEFDPGHPRHPNICDKAGDLSLVSRLQELFRRPKASCCKSKRLQQVLESTLNGLVIIDDSDQLGLTLGIHSLRVVPYPTGINQIFVQINTTLVLVRASSDDSVCRRSARKALTELPRTITVVQGLQTAKILAVPGARASIPIRRIDGVN